MSLEFAAVIEFDFTEDVTVPAFALNQKSDVVIHMRARDTCGGIFDLDDVAQIKVEAYERFCTLADPIFTATRSNGKIVDIDNDNGLYDIVLTPDDTDFEGDSVMQIVYKMNSGEVYKSRAVRVVFDKCFVEPD